MPPHLDPLETLAAACAAYLDEEERALRHQLALVQQTRTSLRQRDIDGLFVTVEQLEGNRIGEQALRLTRMQLREQIERVLGVPPAEATLGAVVRQAPAAWRDALGARRERVQELAKTVDQLNRANVALLTQFGDILSRALEDLTGEPAARRYGPSGRIDTSDSTSLFETNY